MMLLVTTEVKTMRSNEITQSEPERILQTAKTDFIRISAVTAAWAIRYVMGRHKVSDGRQLTGDDFKEISRGMDFATMPIADREFRKSNLRIVMVSSEGKKDDAPFLEGSYGPVDGPEIETIHDAVDGTTLIAQLLSGAISFISGNKKFGRIPPEHNYMVSQTVPPEAKRAKISLSLTKDGHKQTLLNVCEEVGIAPNELTQVLLNPTKKGREVNNIFLEAGNELKVKQRKIDAGDYMSRWFCSLSRDERLRYCEQHHLNPEEFGGYMIMVGRGGATELHAANVIGKITGASTLAYIWDPDIEKIDTQNVFTTERFVPGDKSMAIAVATFATACPWMKQPGVQINPDGSYTTNTMIFTAQKGIEIAKNTFSPKDLD